MLIITYRVVDWDLVFASVAVPVTVWHHCHAIAVLVDRDVTAYVQQKHKLCVFVYVLVFCWW